MSMHFLYIWVMEANWKEISALIDRFFGLKIPQSIDWVKFNHYSIVHHSTAIEGSELNDIETQLLLDEGITAKGKQLIHHNMVKDHFEALKFTLEQARQKTPLSTKLLKQIASLVMKNTGAKYQNVLGEFDSSNGDFRLSGAHAGNSVFMDYKKIPGAVENLVVELNKAMPKLENHKEVLETSFDAHYNLVSIHPFADGNGRTSRLLMNYVQHYHGLPLSIVFKEDKAEYYEAIIQTREEKNPSFFRNFMAGQYVKLLKNEINKVSASKTTSTSNTGKGKPGDNGNLTMYY